MDYTLAEVNEKIKWMADKVGSDYFPLPIILNFFETSTWSFIGERLRHIEETQEITDDIRPLIVVGNLVIAETSTNKYTAALPVNYHRQVAYDVSYADGSTCRRADLMRQAEYQLARTNSKKKPNQWYPIILQENNLFQIDAGGTVPDRLKLTYCKKPTFATTGQPNARIVNLPEDVIENIMLNTVTNLFNKTADQRSQSSYQLEEVFRKAFK